MEQFAILALLDRIDTLNPASPQNIQVYESIVRLICTALASPNADEEDRHAAHIVEIWLRSLPA